MPNYKIKYRPNVQDLDNRILTKLGISSNALKQGDNFVSVDINFKKLDIEDLEEIIQKFDFDPTEGVPLTKHMEELGELLDEIELQKPPTELEINKFKKVSEEAKILYLKEINGRGINKDSLKLQNLAKILAEADLKNPQTLLRKTGLTGDEVEIIYKKLKKVGEKLHIRILKKIGFLDEAANADLVQSMKLVVAGGVLTVVGYLVYFVIANAGKIPEAIKDVLVSLGESAGDAAAFAAETAADVASGGLDTFFKGLSLPLLIGGVVFFVFFIIMMIMMR